MKSKRSTWIELLGLFRSPTQYFSDGSRIRRAAREGYDYLEPGGRVMRVDIALAGGKPVDVALRRDCLSRWMPPHEDEIVSSEKSAEIAEKFRQYLQARGWRFS